ncbi:HXK1 [Auxenochlorella protothecoides x Auxenochlorella symbiontica]
MAYLLAGAAGLFYLLYKGKREAGDRSLQRKILKEYQDLFDVSTQRLRDVQRDLILQVEAGLRGDKSGLLMLPTFVDILPTGDEQGDYYAIDLGGTNLRVLHTRLGPEKGEGEEQDIREWPIPKECFNTDSGKLLEFVADCVEEMLVEHPPASGALPVLGFCFSFGFNQTALNNGVLVRWTKGFYGKGLIGEDIVGALQYVFQARGRAVEIPAILNDTVATLIALRYAEPATQLGIILGTGTNAAYQERIDRIKTLDPGFKGRSEHMVVNTEWGDFFAASLPVCEEDDWVDAASVNPGRGRLEKLVSGLYMGEIVRRALARLGQHAGLFGRAAALPAALLTPGSLGSAAVAAMDEDESADLAAAGAALATLGVARPTRRQRRVARALARLAALRSARLSAAALCALLRHLGWDGRSRVVAAMDGSVFCRYAGYRAMMRDTLERLLGREAAAALELREARDGSVRGAAYLAAAASRYDHAPRA